MHECLQLYEGYMLPMPTHLISLIQRMLIPFFVWDQLKYEPCDGTDKQKYQMQANPTMKKSSITQRRQFNSTFESEASVEQREERFSIKKELYRGIKDNDVSKIIGKPDEKDNETNFLYNEYEEVHRLLTDIRRKHDEVKTTTHLKKKEIDSQKKELEDLRAQEAMLADEIKAAKQELLEAEDRFKKQFDGCENELFTRDVYLNLQEHTKQDNIIMKKRIFDMELELSKCRSRFRSTLNDATNKRKIDEQCQKMMQSMERVVEFEKQKRELRINSIQEVINKKQESFNKKAQRDKEIEKVVINALNEKSPQEKDWIRLLLTNKLVSSILKSKIERELAKHSEIEKAFHNIKLHTGITHCDVFVEKFLNREQDYGELLNSISDKEPKLEKQKQLNETLKQRERELLDQREAVQPTQKQTESAAIRGLLKELEHLEHKQVSFERQQEAFYQWAVKFLKKYDNLTDTSKKRNQMNYYEFYPRTDMVSLYKKVANIINKNLEEIAPKEQMVNVILLKNSMREPTLSDKYYQKNVRVKTLTNPSTAPDQQEAIEFMEDTMENDYLQDFRKMIKKDARNRRFRIKTKPF